MAADKRSTGGGRRQAALFVETNRLLEPESEHVCLRLKRPMKSKIYLERARLSNGIYYSRYATGMP
jgi:hypothetical protein